MRDVVVLVSVLCLLWSAIAQAETPADPVGFRRFEETGGPFYLDESCTEPDPLLDDQALYVETRAGLVVVLGCAHAGTVNTLDYVAELTGGRPIVALLGGMHLVRAGKSRLDATIAALKRHNVERIGAAHCTGMPATAYLWSQLPGQCFECAAGSTFNFDGQAIAPGGADPVWS